MEENKKPNEVEETELEQIEQASNREPATNNEPTQEKEQDLTNEPLQTLPQEPPKEPSLVTGETTTWDFSERIKEVIQPEKDRELVIPSSSPEEEEKPNAFLVWLSQKRVVVTALICLFLIVAGTFIVLSYNWMTTSDAEPESKQAVPPPDKPAHVILQLDDQTYDLDLKTVGYNGQDLKTTDETKLRAWLDGVKKKVDIPMKDATEKKLGGTIHQEQTGTYMDTKQVNQWLQDLPSIINKPQTIPTITLKPTVTEEDLQQVDQKLIGSYTTHFDAGNVNRTTNIKLASEEISGIILNPGKTFSFNKVVGERTAARGYQVAHVIVKGEFSEGIGGGICQVSSTLYNSVDAAGLRIVRRFSHSAKVTYVPPGRDATVSWGGPDFRFKNNLNKPVMIKIKIEGGQITVKTYTVPGAKVRKRKVVEAPKTFTDMQVKDDKPTDKLPADKADKADKA